jgi:hypothetical protein
MEFFAQDVADFVKTFGLSKAPVISHTVGVYPALKLLRHSPDHSKVVVFSPTCMGSSEQIPGFVAEGMKLARKSNKAMAAILGLLARRLIPLELIRASFRKVYAGSKPDIDIINSNDQVLTELVKISTNNLAGIANDYILMLEDWTRFIPSEATNIKIVFGHHDPHCDYRNVLSKIENPAVAWDVFDDFGQVSAMFEPEFTILQALS